MADYYFTDEELELIKKISFSKEVFEILKRAIVKEVRNLEAIIPERFALHIIAHYPHEIEPLYKSLSFDSEDGAVEVAGIRIRGDVIGNPAQFVVDLNRSILPLGHRAFLTMSAATTDDTVAVVANNDELYLFDFLRIGIFSREKTDKKIIKKQCIDLKKEYGSSIIGVGTDWLALYLSELPEDQDLFLSKIKEIAPDSFIWWGKETEEEAYQRVKKNLVETHSITLWWEE